MHWSALLGAFFFGRFQFVPGFWLGFFVLVVVHEIGHAFLVLKRGLRPAEVMVHGFGGHCAYAGGTPFDHAIIAWGGVLAQLIVLFVPTAIYLFFGPPIPNAFVGDMVRAFFWTNLWLVAFNLMPFPPLDGAQAWKLPKMWWQRRRRRGPKKQPKRTHLRAVASSKSSKESPDEAARRIAREALDSARTKH